MSPEENHDAVLAALFSKRLGLIKPGLERMIAARDVLLANGYALGLDIPCVLIGGTNGKGSTAGMLWHMLAGLGVKAGLYTSPHLIHFSERIDIVGETVTDAQLVTELAVMRTLLPQSVYDELSFFEITTLLAWRMFDLRGCECLVLEVGLGGRLDATNIADPLASAIVSIGFDHQSILGVTLRDIAREKAGIMRAGRPVIWGGDEHGGAWEEIKQQADRVGARVIPAQSHAAQWDQPYLPTPYLRANFRVAASLLQEIWRSEFGQKRWGAMISEAMPARWAAFYEDVIRRFGEPSLPWPKVMGGRFQKVVASWVGEGERETKITCIADVCHNVDGVLALREALAANGLLESGHRPALISILGDKDVNEMLDIFKGFLSPIVLFRIKNERSFTRAGIQPRHTDVPMVESFSEAMALALRRPEMTAAQPWVICGSVSAVGEVLQRIGGNEAHRWSQA